MVPGPGPRATGLRPARLIVGPGEAVSFPCDPWVAPLHCGRRPGVIEKPVGCAWAWWLHSRGGAAPNALIRVSRETPTRAAVQRAHVATACSILPPEPPQVPGAGQRSSRPSVSADRGRATEQENRSTARRRSPGTRA